MNDIIASPSVRALAAQKGIDLDARAKELGRTTIGKEDIETPVRNGISGINYWDVDHSVHGEISRQPLSKIDLIASENLRAAQTLIPSVTHHDEADVSKIETFRKSLKAEMDFRDIKLTSLAFFVMSLARTLKVFPKFNASLSPDGTELILKHYVHIGIAVDTEHGLMVPVIRNADQKGLWQIAQEISDLATRATARKVRPHEMGGASMTISNLGGIGGSAFTPIVNPPEVAILGITRTNLATQWINGESKPVPLTPLDLSYDHRVINGADAARFCKKITELIQEPRMLLL